MLEEKCLKLSELWQSYHFPVCDCYYLKINILFAAEMITGFRYLGHPQQKEKE